ncbi:hypothetical protein A6C57_00775 [Fibrella sp. ES10-3-2-2]|nr:hypothetical protein A6C57_00775 [Fibrella sp. ES10-3-2-2]
MICRATVLLLLLSLSHLSTAQLFFTPGYVVTTKGDTLRGEVRDRDNASVWFRSKQDGNDRQYTPETIGTYKAEGQPAVRSAKWLDNDVPVQTFVKEISTGRVSLFELIKPEERLTHAIRLPDGAFIPLRKSMALLILNQHLTGCSDPAVKRLLSIQLYYFSRSYFERVITAYNQCIEPQRSAPAVSRKLAYEAGILAGVAANSWFYGASQASFKPIWNPNGAYSTQYTGVTGLFFTLAPRKKLSLGVEIQYTSVLTEKTVAINNTLDPTDSRTRFYSFKEQYFTMPITARYVIMSVKSVRLYAKAGGSMAYKFNVGGVYSGDNLTNVPIPIKSGLGLGYLLGAGAELPLTNKRHLLIELRTVPHIVLDNVTRLGTSRSYQLTVALPLISR